MIVRAAATAATWHIAGGIARAAFYDAPLLSFAALTLYALVIGWAIWPAIARFTSDSSAT
jgi:hypothetical protein